MSIIKNTVQVWAPNEQVTAAKLNDVIAEAVFDTGAVAAGGEIVVNSLGELEIPDGSLNAGKLANNAVTTDKINAGAVTNAKIADAAVTPAKLSTGRPFWNTDGKVGIGTNSTYRRARRPRQRLNQKPDRYYLPRLFYSF
jgi:hypothetical protein